jgi:hydroxymethylpyrimidine/phosphomethylpyrimidine kinase
MDKPPVIWTIAGFDPSSGAGITADLKTIAAHGCYGVACITALTVQNTLGVLRVEPVSPTTVRDTLQALLDDLPPAAIKIGMLGTATVASTVADFLETLPGSRVPIVLDPILRSSLAAGPQGEPLASPASTPQSEAGVTPTAVSGAQLLDNAGIGILRARLLPLCTVVTPNRREASVLTGLPAASAEEAARALRKLGAAAAVVTGGDALGAHDARVSEDVLAYAAGGAEFVETLSAPRLQSTATHGSGCAFSTALACRLARGESIPAAATAAKSFVHNAIKRSPGLGHGHGPMGLESAGKD